MFVVVSARGSDANGLRLAFRAAERHPLWALALLGLCAGEAYLGKELRDKARGRSPECPSRLITHT